MTCCHFSTGNRIPLTTAVPGHLAEGQLAGGHPAEGQLVEDQGHQGINLPLKLVLPGLLDQPGEPSSNVPPARKKLRNLPLLPNLGLDPPRSPHGPSGNVGVHDFPV